MRGREGLDKLAWQMWAAVIAIVVLAAGAGCKWLPSQRVTSTAGNSESPLRFEIRGLRNEATDQSISGLGTSTLYAHKATIVALGDSTAGRSAYMVVCGLSRISGGDPASPRDPDSPTVVVLSGGVGELRVSGGYKTPSEKWNPERVRVKILGYVKLKSSQGEASE